MKNKITALICGTSLADANSHFFRAHIIIIFLLETNKSIKKVLLSLFFFTDSLSLFKTRGVSVKPLLRIKERRRNTTTKLFTEIPNRVLNEVDISLRKRTVFVPDSKRTSNKKKIIKRKKSSIKTSYVSSCGL